VERFHQTQKRWLANQPRAATLASCRPSSTPSSATTTPSGRTAPWAAATPAEAYAARPKAAPSGIPLIDGHCRVRHDKIDTNGKLTLRHSSRLHHIGLGRRYAGTSVLVLVHDLHIRAFSTSGQLLRDLIVDPSRDYQPRAEWTMFRDTCERCLGTSQKCPRGDTVHTHTAEPVPLSDQPPCRAGSPSPRGAAPSA
jgi:hypothetical protein